jgi:hypothetical protein
LRKQWEGEGKLKSRRQWRCTCVDLTVHRETLTRFAALATLSHYVDEGLSADLGAMISP